MNLQVHRKLYKENMRKFLITANWKLNGNIEMIAIFLKFLNNYLITHKQKNIIVLAPPVIYLDRVYQNIKHSRLFLGSQNVDVHLQGAFTGEISGIMLKDIGVKYVIIGHSERRILHHENNELIVDKFRLIKSLKLVPILCIGETEKEKKYCQTEKILENQLNCIFNALGKQAFRKTVIAYEPIWAIGTGLSENPKNVQLIHEFIKNYIREHDMESIKDLIIQYGGSIDASKTKIFLEQPDINGLLIGGASIKYREFIKIIDIANNII